jgi:probable F420-dependent oxidoreductase
MPLTSQRDLVAALPDLGYTDAWSSEVKGHDAFTPLALAAQWTSKEGAGTLGTGPDGGGLRLGTAVANIYTRGPALLAMSAATLAALAPGRFVLGIGVSSPAVVTDWNGIALERPYQRARDTLRFLRRALAGEKVSMDGDTFSISGFRLDPAPVPPPTLALAALRPGMISLAAELSDGAITNWLSPEDVPTVRAVAGPDCELIARIFVCLTADAGLAREIGRRMIAAYLTVPAYAAFHDWLGRGPRLQPMAEAWAAGDRKGALAAIGDDLVDELVVHGPPGHCRERVAEYQAATWIRRSSRSCRCPAWTRPRSSGNSPRLTATGPPTTRPRQFLAVPGLDQPVRDGHRGGSRISREASAVRNSSRLNQCASAISSSSTRSSRSPEAEARKPSIGSAASATAGWPHNAPGPR